MLPLSMFSLIQLYEVLTRRDWTVHRLEILSLFSTPLAWVRSGPDGASIHFLRTATRLLYLHACKTRESRSGSSLLLLIPNLM